MGNLFFKVTFEEVLIGCKIPDTEIKWLGLKPSVALLPGEMTVGAKFFELSQGM